MKQYAKKLLTLLGSATLVTTGFASTAEATDPVPLTCNTVINAALIAAHTSNDFVLSADVGPCVNNGIVVAASGTASDPITLDLNGWDIFGTQASDGGVGVLVTLGSAHVVVTNSTYASTANADSAPAAPVSEIYEFDAGVAIEKGSSNVTVKNLHIRDNGDGFSPAEYGDGIAISDAKDNTVRNNYFGVAGAPTTIPYIDCTDPLTLPNPPNDCWSKPGANGAFSAVGLYETKETATVWPNSGNVVEGNVIHNTYRCFSTPYTRPGTCQSDGVRLEPGVSNNRVEKNRIYGGALDGIALISGATDNQILSNIVEKNGAHHRTHRKGDGIRLLGAANNKNEIKWNRVCGNAAHGIRIDLNSLDNTITDNHVGDGTTVNPINAASPLPACGANHVVTTTAEDLFDGNTACGFSQNVWTGNFVAGSNTRNQGASATCIG